LFVRKAKKANLSLLSINTNFDYLPLDLQFEISKSLHKRHPQSFNFIGSFDASAFYSKTFAVDSIEQIKKCRAAGARGIKIWKNIGMTLKNESGQYVMADDPVFDSIYAFLEKERIPLLAHLGEPRNCWLPLENMTTSSDVRYFSKSPEFHMYLHPEAPSYEQHLIVRDHILERFPELIFVGAHLSSMECDLEEIAKRLDRYPNFYVDISGRFSHIIDQTLKNRDRVIDFFQTYQNRIIYGLDYFVFKEYSQEWINLFCKCFPKIYIYLLFIYLFRMIKNQWMFFATGEAIKSGSKQIDGLRLEKTIIDRIFYQNAQFVYFTQNDNK